MPAIPTPIAFIGFGEAGMAFAQGLAKPAIRRVAAYDRKTYVGATRHAKREDYARLGIAGATTNRAAVAGARLILSLVTADKALAAARETACGIGKGAIYCDMNSVSPETKRRAAAAIAAAGGYYADVAVMAPVHPSQCAVPLLVSGPHATAAVEALAEAGFVNGSVIGANVGDAAAVKMIRSVMVKGIEALTAECVLAADQAGVLDEVVASLDASSPGVGWRARAAYNLERMMAHGMRRADEMEEVVKTLDALGTGSAMSRATVERQRAIGRLALDPFLPLADRIAALLGRCRGEAT